MSNPHAGNGIPRLYRDLYHLRQNILDSEQQYNDMITNIRPEWRQSAVNLAHYLGLRQQDIRPLQIELSTFGLSSLGRLEAHVLAGIESVLYALQRMASEPMDPIADHPRTLNFKEGDQLLFRHTEELLGPTNSERIVRIMVTMPSEAANDYALVRNLIETGMNVMRINSAHDDEATWIKMAQNARKAASELNRSCRILFDLCGPKLRTGNIEPGPAVIHFQPKRDARGSIIEPALVWIGPSPPPAEGSQSTTGIPVDTAFSDALGAGDIIKFTDIQGRPRSLIVLAKKSGGAWVESRQSTYLEPEIDLHLMRDDVEITTGKVGSMPRLDSFIFLNQGDVLILTNEDQPGIPARRGSDGALTHPAQIPCTLPSVFKDIREGDPILFDDGKFSGVVTSASTESIRVTIQRTPPGGAKLRSDKGINLPLTKLSAPALSPQDLKNLDFAVNYVDMIGLSFVNEISDVYQLQQELSTRGGTDLGIVLKIETRLAFENLPQLLFAGLQNPPLGVMVARGDLGVEIGFERLAEVQEQILWLCEAAHVPVIWATQVLESLAKKGMPTRAEVTDASMSGRAECVMLNKGPFIVQTVEFLEGVLARMREHHHKKTPMLRKLKVSEGRFGE